MNNKSILITGGTGSFGKKFLETILKKKIKVKRLVIFSRDELKQSEMAIKYPSKKYPFIRFFIGDIRDLDRLKRALNKIDLTNEPCTQLDSNLYPQLKISTKSGEGINKLKKEISETLFGEVMAGWVHFLPIHAAIRSKLFDSGCIIEEKIDENGCYQSFIEISQNMFKQLEDLENFKNLKPVS